MVDAGSNQETCQNVAFNLALSTTPPSQSNTSSLSWSDGGAGGSFSNATVLQPTYTPPVGFSGSITLTLTGNGNRITSYNVCYTKLLRGRIEPDDIAPASESIIDVMRVAAYAHQMDEAIWLAHHCMDKGYEVTVNLMAVSNVMERDLDEALNRITSYNVCYTKL